MKAKFKLQKSTVVDGLKWYHWLCMSGTTYYQGKEIFPGTMYSQTVFGFWLDKEAIGEILVFL